MKEYFQKTFKEKKAVLNGKGCISMIALATTVFNCQAMYFKETDQKKTTGELYADAFELNKWKFPVSNGGHINCKSKDLIELWNKINESKIFTDIGKKRCLSYVAVSLPSFNMWREEFSKNTRRKQSLIPILQNVHKIKITITKDDYKNYQTADCFCIDLRWSFLENYSKIKKILKIEITEDSLSADIFRTLKQEQIEQKRRKQEQGPGSIKAVHAIKKDGDKLDPDINSITVINKCNGEDELFWIPVSAYKTLVSPDIKYRYESVPFKINIRLSDLINRTVDYSYLCERPELKEQNNSILTIYSTEESNYSKYIKVAEKISNTEKYDIVKEISAIHFIILNGRKETDFFKQIRLWYTEKIIVYNQTDRHSMREFGIAPGYDVNSITTSSAEFLDGYEGHLKLKKMGYSSLWSTVPFKSLSEFESLTLAQRKELKESVGKVEVVCRRDERIHSTIDLENIDELKVEFRNDDSLETIMELKRKHKDKIIIFDSNGAIIDLRPDSDIDQTCSIDNYLALKKHGLPTNNRVLGFQSCQKFKEVLEEQFSIQIDQKHKIEEKLKELRSQVKDIEIAFAKEDCKGFRETEIPWYATKVKANAFDDGATIEKITVESTGTIFEKDSLRKLSSLNEIRIPGSITPKEFYEKLIKWNAGVKPGCRIISEFLAE